MSGICKNRVVMVTGAGNGLGRSYALGFALEGAKVVVNDIDEASAHKTVTEIQKLGGEGLVNTSDITNYDACGKAIETVIAQFGDIHALVNNAGICRDKMFVNLTEQDWDQVMQVHLKGHFCLSSHVAKYWRSQAKAGKEVNARIINTSSGAGLQGSIAQSNYAAAKGGIATLTLVQAAELGRYGITVNGLAPSGRTQMTADVFADMMKKPEDGSFDFFDPANVAPLVVWLGSAASQKVNGKIFEVAGGKISISDGWRTTAGLDKGSRWETQELTAAINKILTSEVPPQPVYGAKT